MSTNIADLDLFTDPIVAPADGDAANGALFLLGLQGLANRTRHHKVLIDALNIGQVIGTYKLGVSVITPIAPTDKVPLTQLTMAGGLVLAADEVTLPSAGLYLIAVHGTFACVASGDDALFTVKLVSTVVGSARVERAGTEFACGSISTAVVAGSGNKVTVVAGANGLIADSDYAQLTIVKLR